MKKIIIILMQLILITLTAICGCSETNHYTYTYTTGITGPHWSYNACLADISEQVKQKFRYTVTEIDHTEYYPEYDEIHCFDITIMYDGISKRYCCFAAIINGTVSFTDCDLWKE